MAFSLLEVWLEVWTTAAILEAGGKLPRGQRQPREDGQERNRS